jgi:hypothetical protein
VFPLRLSSPLRVLESAYLVCDLAIIAFSYFVVFDILSRPYRRVSFRYRSYLTTFAAFSAFSHFSYYLTSFTELIRELLDEPPLLISWLYPSQEYHFGAHREGFSRKLRLTSLRLHLLLLSLR